MFDPPERVRWAAIPVSVVASARHAKLAYEAAVRSCVLLKNQDAILPLRSDLRSLYITGPQAASVDALLGNYYGLPARCTTLLEGITAALPEGVRCDYRPGCLASTPKRNELEWAEYEASRCEVTVVCLGLTALLEGEEGDAIASGSRGDREDILLPADQLAFLGRLIERGAKVVVVLTGGGALSLGPLTDKVHAILWAGYPGQEGGRAVADLLFSHATPSGKLPVTFYHRIEDLPAYEDYAMRGRTHRWFEGGTAYPFGFGLGYGRIVYSELDTPRKWTGKGPLWVAVTVSNAGARAAEEVVQLYATEIAADGRGPVPVENLLAFRRVKLSAGQSRTVRFAVPAKRLRLVDNEGRRERVPVAFTVVAGGCSPAPHAVAKGAPEPVRARVSVAGVAQSR
jgi:beta-glucosidase